MEGWDNATTIGGSSGGSMVGYSRLMRPIQLNGINTIEALL